MNSEQCTMGQKLYSQSLSWLMAQKSADKQASPRILYDMQPELSSGGRVHALFAYPAIPACPLLTSSQVNASQSFTAVILTCIASSREQGF